MQRAGQAAHHRLPEAPTLGAIFRAVLGQLEPLVKCLGSVACGVLDATSHMLIWAVHGPVGVRSNLCDCA
jgi:hypothetical protein